VIPFLRKLITDKAETPPIEAATVVPVALNGFSPLNTTSFFIPLKWSDGMSDLKHVAMGIAWVDGNGARVAGASTRQCE
jgi:hypothetical protein